MKFYLPLVIAFLQFCCAPVYVSKDIAPKRAMNRPERQVYRRSQDFIYTCIQGKGPVKLAPKTAIDSVIVIKSERLIRIYINQFLAYIPFRSENVNLINTALAKSLGFKFRNYRVILYSLNEPIEQLIPNYYRESPKNYDAKRLPPVERIRPESVVRNISKPWQPTRGLSQRNIAIWHSHGWYYNNEQKHWQWQRPRLFQTVEDLLPASFVIPYLMPMLENAGANVFLPRERDIQSCEIIVDNDSSRFSSEYRETWIDSTFRWQKGAGQRGFRLPRRPLRQGDNPFKKGTYVFTAADTGITAKICWLPDFSESGEYSVSISYRSDSLSVTDAHYTVYHCGGKTEFLVNQQIGGSTWIYLGTFRFSKGKNPELGRVELINKSKTPGRIISADAVRFGGGTGNVARENQVSNRPRFLEAARYYLQYAGMPDTLVYCLNKNKNDYKDDLQCRGEWVNYLNGAPGGPNLNRQVKGLGIPIDASIAIHTDAGIKRDSTFGTLAIYSLEDFDSSRIFPDGISRFACRDLADIVQTQIVDDIRRLYDPDWLRRPLLNSQYNEASRPNVPAVMLELLSHQNFPDMRLAQDPHFKFDLSRAIYKGILRFIATQNRTSYVVQPLPVTHLAAEFVGNDRIKLSWRPQKDSLEVSADPTHYIVYTRIDSLAFNNGNLVTANEIIIPNIKTNVIYSFKVTAVNDGGESFPSEVLSVCRLNDSKKPVLIINAFDRVCGPATFESGKYAGFIDYWDQGVPCQYDLNRTGSQINFLLESPYISNESPGFGASYADLETKIIAGNTFNYAYIHGVPTKNAGYSFVSVSDEAVMDGIVDITKYPIVDIILGEEKTTEMPGGNPRIGYQAFPAPMQEIIRKYVSNKGRLFISGAYIASDLYNSGLKNDRDFADKILKIRLAADHAVRNGEFYATDPGFVLTPEKYRFCTEMNPIIYNVEAPDALAPANSDAKVILRYSENQFGAGVAYKGNYRIICFGFPFETIETQTMRNKIMKAVLDYFK